MYLGCFFAMKEHLQRSPPLRVFVKSLNPETWMGSLVGLLSYTHLSRLGRKIRINHGSQKAELGLPVPDVWAMLGLTPEDCFPSQMTAHAFCQKLGSPVSSSQSQQAISFTSICIPGPPHPSAPILRSWAKPVYKLSGGIWVSCILSCICSAHFPSEQ